MIRKLMSLAMVAFIGFVLASCAATHNVTKESVVLLDENVELAPMDALGVKESLSIVVLFDENSEEILHDIRVCQCDLENRMCGLFDWVETDIHPSDPELLGLINEAWEEDYPESKIIFIEGEYFPEPVGDYKVEAIYYPQR